MTAPNLDLRAVTIATMVFIGCAAPAYAAGIEWEVKHRFRFFPSEPQEDTSIFYRMHEQAWNELISSGSFDPDTAISQLESKLNDEVWLAAFLSANAAALGVTPLELQTVGRAQFGWSSHIIRQNATCWSQPRQWHSDCRTDAIGKALRTDYVKPQRHTVVARLDAAARQPLAGEDCVWSTSVTSVFLGLPGSSTERTLPCDQAVELRIPFKLDDGDSQATPTTITVRSATNGTSYSADIAVRDYLIVGFGDSFSSGEGNPDAPARMKFKPFKDTVPDYRGPFLFNEEKDALVRAGTVVGNFSFGYIVPQRETTGAYARWQDRNCHRSLYSYHSRVAIQMALAGSKHSAVTFLGYACSGSKITEGILLDYDGVEAASNYDREGRERRTMPQMARLIEELCASPVSTDRDDWIVSRSPTGSPIIVPLHTRNGEFTDKAVRMPICGSGRPADFLRPVDLLILSIGGNDVGFAQLVSHVLLSNPATFADRLENSDVTRNILAGLAEQFASHDVRVAEKKALRLAEKYEVLVETLAATGIPLRTRTITEPSGREIKRPQILLTAFPEIQNNQSGELCGTSDDRSETMRGMTLAPGFVRANPFRLRSVAAFSEDLNRLMVASAGKLGFIFVDEHRTEFNRHGFCARDTSSAKPEEQMTMPFFITSSTNAQGWHAGINAHRWRCYTTTQRWIRSFDDSFLCSNTVHGDFGQTRDETELMMISLGGPIHPTAEGHAHIADAVWNVMRSIPELGLQ